VLSVTGAHCDLHAAKPGGAPVELCVTDSGGHSWPGAGGQRGRELRKADERRARELREMEQRCRKGKALDADDCSRVAAR
jgi:poly(3-hydroxybutyrate) depolymerase